MFVPEGGSMAHVSWAQFWPLFGVSLAIPAQWALRLLRSFLRS